jgi:hypothetical protein
MRFDAAWSYAGRTGIVRDIDVTWTERWSLGGASDLRRVIVSLPIPAGIGVPALVAAGIPLTTMTVTISAGGRELLSGNLRASSYGQAGEPIEGELGDDEREDRAIIPEPLLVVDSVTWPDAPSDSLRSPYPVVFGTPGVVGSRTIPATPAIVVDSTTGAEWLLVAAGHVPATTVTVWGPQYPGAELMVAVPMGIESRLDGRGQPVTVLAAYLFGQQGYPAWGSSSRYYVSWTGGEALPGRLDRLATSLLGQSTLEVDEVAQAAQSAALSRYQCAGYVDAGVAPSELLSRIVEALPVSMQRSPDGMYLAGWAADIEDAPVSHSIIVGQGAHRDGLVRYVVDEPTVSVRLEYAYDLQRGAYSAAAAVGAAQTLRGSRGPGRAAAVDAGHVYDPATAEAAALSMLTGSSRWRELELVVDEDRYGWGADRELRVGQVVAVTDATVSIAAERARVVAIERDRGGMRVTLRLRG